MTTDQLELDRSLDGLELPDWLWSVLAKPVFTDHFDRPFGLNDAVVFPAAWLGRTRLVDRIEERTTALNNSDVALSRLADVLIRVHGGVDGARASKALAWRRGLEELDNLRVAPLAIELLTELAAHTDVAAEAERLQPGVTRGLRQLPGALRDLTRFNLCFHPDERMLFPAYLRALERAQLLPMFERVDLVDVHDAPGAFGVRLFLDPQPACPHDEFRLDAVLTLSQSLSSTLRGAPTQSDQHAITVDRALSLNQGFSMIKRYLEPFGLLVSSYDQTTGFRIASTEHADPSGVASWLRSRFRYSAASNGHPSPSQA